jgi:hypothetical protein
VAGAARSLVEALTWRAATIPTDLPGLIQADLAWTEPVTLEDANRFLLEDLAWLLGIYAGRWIVPGGVWHPGKRLGYLPDLDRPLTAPLRRTVDVGERLENFLKTVATAWRAADETRRRALKIAIGSRLSAANGDLELSVAVMSLALEMLVECLFGEDGGQPSSAAVTADLASYGLTKSQKKPIKQALREAIVANVDEYSDYRRDIEVIIGRLFWRTAADKIRQMLGHYKYRF